MNLESSIKKCGPCRAGLVFPLAILVLLQVAILPVDAANFVVRMQSTRFNPRDITITAGDSITWTNLEFSSHDSVSGTNGVPSGYWRTPLFGFGGAATVVFTNVPPGRYGYYCTPHVFAGMVGSVTVLPANAPPVANFLEPAAGAVVPAGVPLPILVDALDSDGRVSRVDFSVDGAGIGSDSVGPFTATYANPSPGPHTLRAVAVDDRGATSAPVVITITALLPPAILQPPQSLNVLEFSPATFLVVATGAPPLRFQWQFNDSPIGGATNSSLTIQSTRTNDAGGYSVVVSNPVGVVTSAAATLAVTANRLPDVTLQTPTNGAFLPEGANLRLLADASDPDGFIQRVEFLSNGQIAFVATNAPFTGLLENLQGDHQYVIAARAVENHDGATTTPAVIVNVLSPPTIAITEPLPASSFPLGQLIAIEYATGTSRFPLSVELFSNDATLFPTNQFVPAATGNYVLSAMATDLAGQRATSAPVTVRVYQPETVPPSIAITNAPADFARLTEANVTIAGVADDDVGVLRVEVENLSTGTLQTADGTQTWIANVVLTPGVNTVRVRSVDQAFNTSPWVTRYFTYVVNSRLTVTTRGQGTVSPNLDGKLLEIGKTFRITAKPGRGRIFAGWGGATGQGTALDFVMRSNLVLTAIFVTNPFVPAAGSYAGLFTDTNTYARDGNGMLTLQISESGAFSGRLRSSGRKLPFRGFLDTEGYGHAVALRPGQSPIAVAFKAELQGETGTLRGSATDGNWVADLLASRNPYAMGTNPCPFAGRRAFAWNFPEAQPPVAVSVVSISPRGTATASATFAGNRRQTVATSVSAMGTVPLAFADGHFDSVMGWAQFGLTGDSRVVGIGQLIPAATNTSPSPLILSGFTP